jgi:hypothetical protein
MSIFDKLFGKPVESAQVVYCGSECRECNQYRQTIAQASSAGNEQLAEDLRHQFAHHCQQQHARVRR